MKSLLFHYISGRLCHIFENTIFDTQLVDNGNKIIGIVLVGGRHNSYVMVHVLPSYHPKNTRNEFSFGCYLCVFSGIVFKFAIFLRIQ